MIPQTRIERAIDWLCERKSGTRFLAVLMILLLPVWGAVLAFRVLQEDGLFAETRDFLKGAWKAFRTGDARVTL